MLDFITAKMVYHIVCFEKLILYLYWNHKHVSKDCFQTQNTHLFYRKFLPMCYFELQIDLVKSKYTPKSQGFLSCFLIIIKQQCIRLRLCKLAWCANKWSCQYFLSLFVSRAFMAGAASQAGDADSSRTPGLTSGLQGSVNVHRGALLLVPQWQCISSFVFYIR